MAFLTLTLAAFCFAQEAGRRLTFRDNRPVIDQAGLKGYYDFTLTYLPDLPDGYDMSKLPPGMADWPPLCKALKDQLGLKLEAKKGHAEVYVIDSSEKPLSN